MAWVQLIAFLAFIVCGVFTDSTVGNDPIRGSGAQTVYEQHIIINPLDGLSCSGTVCNYSTIQEIVSGELQNTTRRLAQLETHIASKSDVMTLSTELTYVKLQLEKIKESVSELAELLKNATVIPATSPFMSPAPPKDCSDVFANGVTTSGVYKVQPAGHECSFNVYCDMETDGGGWTVFQRRQDGIVDFYRDWESYRQGFGDLNGEFWLGNDNLHRLTAQGEYRLRVDLEDFENITAYAEYDTFRVADGRDSYQLTAIGYSGTAGDSLSGHSNHPFSTKDRDNDSSDSECAIAYSGAWWYSSCHSSNLNGLYLSGETDVYAKGVVWQGFKGYYYSLKRTEMKIKITYN
ncbi:microfibril-associated glycoprotein 4-like [Acanthaster planci]|uniref:Microfibril-associated glycoprotein 4-like n=1 Tax=Acanthaster planci TaxID=133434 RepID=A0A8B7ZPB5_ACAPL|nr:microfibril-associated glycoprotein 4-like [Acanthaster planci]